MPHETETASLAKQLRGRKLVIPDLKRIFSHWPNGQNENYLRMKDAVTKKLATVLSNEKHQKAVNDADPALLAARWWPMSSWEQYQVMTDLVIWFGIWDDYIEKLVDPRAADEFRMDTKKFVAQSLGLSSEGTGLTTSNPLIRNFEGIAREICMVHDDEQRQEILGHFEKYIDATRLEAEFEKSESVPSLEEYWEVRTLTSGMGTLLGMSEFALQAKLPRHILSSPAYETLWVLTIVINSIVNDLISMKKEMLAGSVLSSVAILFHEFHDLDIAVQLSVDRIKQLIDLYDRTAELLLLNEADDPKTNETLSRTIDLFRMVNTGNLEWSLVAKRYGVSEFIQDDGRIELRL